MFEFGTASGRTTYLWAKNSPAEAKITTITLGPDQLNQYQEDKKDLDSAKKAAKKESIHEQFIYSKTAVESKITQLFQDSKTLDETPYFNKCDLIFIDGSHSYSYVKSDSEKALKMIKKGGVILWHDYTVGLKRNDGVFEYLNELQNKVDLVRFNGTTIVAYKKP